ncbi:type II secretion system F family protein [Sinosporangium album]|nr:type II secretion system F family protein [Sinosporangium album]
MTALWCWSAPHSETARLRRLHTGGDVRQRRHFKQAWSIRTAWLLHIQRHAVWRGKSQEVIAWRRAQVEFCQGLSAELSAGRTPGEAMVRVIATSDFPDPSRFAAVAAAAQDGRDVAAALVRAAPRLGGEGLQRLAACWQASHTAGAALAPLIDQVAASLRASLRHHEELTAHLSGPRATAKLLAILPLLGILMGIGLGMSPLDFLFGGPAGFACLAAGVALNLAGLWWIHRMVSRVQEP